jgi:hypothetical protein
VFSNVDSSPTLNFTSVNGLYVTHPMTPRQPKFTDTDWAQLYKGEGSTWSLQTDEVGQQYTPILQLNYADGTIDGIGYMESWITRPNTISGLHAVRERFTVTGTDRRVLGAAVRVLKVKGRGGLSIRLEHEDGTLIEAGSVPASAIGLGYTWTSITFNIPHILLAGQTYHLLLTAPSDTTYQTFALRNGSKFGFSGSTVFSDGYAQYTTGSDWTGFDMWGTRNRTDGDLQFYFK